MEFKETHGNGKPGDPIILKGARLVDHQSGLDRVGDIVITGETIASVDKDTGSTAGESRVIDVSDYVICPAFCDAHVHLRTPGQEEKEDIASGCKAAARGGVTTMVTMPNTSPPIDSPEAVASLAKRYSDEGFLEIFIAPAISSGRKGSVAADWEGMLKAGGVAFTDDGDWAADEKLMHDVLEFSSRTKVLVLSHAEDKSLHDGGCVNDGYASRYLRVPAIPAESEVAAVKRDIELCAKTGGRLHIQHVSTGGAIELIRKAKKEGLPVTCEATPHHLLLTEEDVINLGTNGKMNPPLRSEHDRRELLKGLQDGTVDIIATDHAPHTVDDKKKSITEAPFGVTGLETMFASLHEELVLPGKITLSKLIELLTSKPRGLFNLPPVALQPGSRADMAIIDPGENWAVEAEDFLSKGKNNAFIHEFFTGQVVCTIHRGRQVFRVDGFPEM